jgi:hypothetical protein
MTPCGLELPATIQSLTCGLSIDVDEATVLPDRSGPGLIERAKDALGSHG